MSHHQFEEVIETEAELQNILGIPSEVVFNKAITIIDKHCETFIQHSPFITIASVHANGTVDVSPKGDPAGFVKVLDDKTLAIPDRLGNRRADTFKNILSKPQVGILFMIPGIRETLRVNGKAQIITDLAIREQLAHKGKIPQLVLIVHVEEAFMHCSKCMIRSKLWEEQEANIRTKIPSLATILKDHAVIDAPVEQLDDYLKKGERERLY
ncbi:MAG: MSMEG_1061 family FMN-dependent PPOX-type flavoprotein [Bacteroidota bacterium]